MHLRDLVLGAGQELQSADRRRKAACSSRSTSGVSRAGSSVIDSKADLVALKRPRVLERRLHLAHAVRRRGAGAVAGGEDEADQHAPCPCRSAWPRACLAVLRRSGAKSGAFWITASARWRRLRPGRAASSASVKKRANHHEALPASASLPGFGRDTTYCMLPY